MSDFLDDDDDDIEAMPRKEREEEEMDITPMIDITFLLLIFFVVASKMDPTQTGKIPDATNGLAVSAKDSAVIFIEPSGGEDAILRRRNMSEFSKDEEAQAVEIVEYITNELEKSKGKAKNQVMLLGDAEVKVSQVSRVQKIIGDEFTDMEFTYIAVKEE